MGVMGTIMNSNWKEETKMW